MSADRGTRNLHVRHLEAQPSPDAAISARRCVSCQREALGERCHFCGAAFRVRGYTVVEVLAESARGRVYRARGQDGVFVALKELVYSTDPSIREIEVFE